jgi:hypothetical protein
MPRHGFFQRAERLPVVLAKFIKELTTGFVAQGFEDRVHIRHYVPK